MSEVKFIVIVSIVDRFRFCPLDDKSLGMKNCVWKIFSNPTPKRATIKITKHVYGEAGEK